MSERNKVYVRVRTSERGGERVRGRTSEKERVTRSDRGTETTE